MARAKLPANANGGSPRSEPPSALHPSLISSCERRLSWPPGRKSQPAWPSAERPPRCARASSRPRWSGFPPSRATSRSSAHWRSRTRRRSVDVSPLLDTPKKHPTVGSGRNHTRFFKKRRVQHRAQTNRHVVGSGCSKAGPNVARLGRRIGWRLRLRPPGRGSAVRRHRHSAPTAPCADPQGPRGTPGRVSVGRKSQPAPRLASRAAAHGT